MMITKEKAKEMARNFLDNMIIEDILRLAEYGCEMEINDGRVRAINVPKK